MKKFKNIPKFKNEREEADFWEKQDSTKYIDYSRAKKKIFPNLKLSTKTVSIRLPESLIEYLKILSNKKDVPYQSLMKIFLIERVKKELHLSDF